jgi:type I restriction enzyme S subunit
MEEIAALWGEAKLGVLCTITTGDKDVNEGNPSGEFSFFTCAQEISKSNSYSFDGEAILIAGNGNFSVKKYKGKFEAYQRTYVLQNFKISPAYLYYFISHRLSEITKDNRGSTIRYIRIGNLTDYDVTFPCDKAQHRIVAKIEELFSELDKGIENLNTARAQLKVYRQALLKHAFEGKLTAQWREQNKDKLETAAALLARIQTEREQRYQQQFKQWQTTGGSKPKAPKLLPPLTAEELAELPELPKGWGWFTVAHICDVVRGGSPRPAGDPKFYCGNIPFLKVADITTTSTPYLSSFTYTITEAGLSKTRQIEPNTLLLSNSGATLGVPKICLIAATMNDGVAAFLGLRPEELLFHYYFWQGKTEHLRNINQGAAQPNLNTDLIKEIYFPICLPSEQIAVTQKLEAALSEVDQLDQTITTSLQQAEALRQSILKKAFSGQLVVQDADDEPAAALLARIKAERITNKARPKP